MNNKEQTAVGLTIEKLSSLIVKSKQFDMELVEQKFKEIEKEQLISAYMDGFLLASLMFSSLEKIDINSIDILENAKGYYKQKYNL